MRRFWDKVNKTPGLGPQGECWEWTACIRSKGTGYGAFKLKGKVIDAHRRGYILQIGAIPTDKLVCHTCDNRLCVKGEHLFVGTHNDNNQDMFRKGRDGIEKTHLKLRKIGKEDEAWCYICQAFKPKNQFYKNKSQWNGLDKLCKPHHDEKRKFYLTKQKEKAQTNKLML